MSISKLYFEDELKKINSNDTKPLDTLITEKTNTITSGQTTTNSLINTLKTGAVPIVKSVQSGEVNKHDSLANFNVTISSVNPSKSILILNSFERLNDTTSSWHVYSPCGNISSSNTITLEHTSYYGSSNNFSYRWQVIEFY